MEKKETLVAYFAPKGYDSPCAMVANNMLNGLKESGIDAKAFAITPIETYPSDKDELMAVARIEKENHSRPELTSKCSGYEYVRKVVLVVPNWFDSVPMGVMTFLEQYSNVQKRIIPVVLHGGDGAQAIVRELRHLLPKTDIMPAIEVGSEEIDCLRGGQAPGACGCSAKFAMIMEELKEK